MSKGEQIMKMLKEKKEKKSSVKTSSSQNERIQQVGIELRDASMIYQKVEEFKLKNSTSSAIQYIAPETETAKKITKKK